MRGTPSRLRATALMAAGALTLHELRYALASPGAEQAATGHGYLPLAGLGCALILAVAFAQLVTVAARARRSGSAAQAGLGFSASWLLCTVGLGGIFVAQELLEVALVTGRAGAPAVLGAGAWVFMPLSVLLGALVALALVGARLVVAAAAARRRRSTPRRAPAAAGPRPPGARFPRRPSLARNLLGRGPPLPA